MGVERQVQIGKDTEIFGQAKVGDRIQLWVQPNGYAQTIIIVRSGTP
jgi:acyl-[acyl carrier protein]--UDP-N-acetylglucosamine O-acyltransferase